MYVADMTKAEAKEWLKCAQQEGLTADDIQDLKELIAGRSVQR